MFNKQSAYCHICSAKIRFRKGESLPPACPACGADLENPFSETLRDVISCEHLKGALGIGTGEMYITDKRLFWMPRKDEDSGNILVGAITGKNADKVSVNIPLGEIERIGDCKKLLRIGITVYTKNGEGFNFYLVNRGKPQILKDFLAPHVGNIFES